MEVRDAVYQSLLRFEQGKQFANLALDAALSRYDFSFRDRSFFTALFYGVIEKQIPLDYLIGRFSSKPLDKIEPRLLPILRMGVYQILYLDGIPDRAATSECVELAKRYTHKGTEGFVNGILRSIVRQKEALPWPPQGSDDYLSVYYAMPLWLITMWQEMYGTEKTEAMLVALNEHPRMTLRANTLKITREALIDRLRELGIEAEETPFSPHGVRLCSDVPISALTPLTEGFCFVQDETSQLAVAAVGAKPGETVIDTCACPGGKSFGMAMDMEGQGRLVSLDLHESKLSLVKNGAERLGISCLEAAVHNGRQAREDLKGIADRVLCDVPCSGLGVIAKKPDLRFKDPKEIEGLPTVQYEILTAASSYVKAGGRLVYSTCTLNKKENEEVVCRFLQEHPAFSLDSAEMRTFVPDEGQNDGFFVAVMRRNS